MYKIRTKLAAAIQPLRKQYKFQIFNVLTIRNVSALHITGDKASENYVTIQPFLDFKGTFDHAESVESSIMKRRMQMDMGQVRAMYDNYKKAILQIEKVDKERDDIAKQLKEMSKVKSVNDSAINQLKEQGKTLRNNMKAMKTELYPIEDEFIQAFLNLPNMLHPQCPDGDYERLLYRSKQQVMQRPTKSHLDFENLIRFLDNSRYYLMNEAAEFDLHCTDALTKYFLEQGKFMQTCNPDFVRCVLLEANATPLTCYHKVMEQQLQNQLNCAYLTGGGAFESFLGAVTKLVVYPSVVPLKYICSGRLYEKSNEEVKPSLYTATQTNAVQTFVATLNAQQSEEQMDAILNMCLDFYKSFENLNFRIVYVKASDLTAAESLRAQIEVYSQSERRYVCVGRVSNYTDYVSKRILFTMREQKEYKFLHLVGGPILYTSRLIAALIESGEALDCRKVQKTLQLNETSCKDSSNKPIDDFKSLFK
ncbi:serine--tRNA synthetase-like protein Slimp [Stomoxys calcitrans]|uniref:serine--tRNA synthetase-like protein Slimp n=1 Tax=Stomoxys calcitrans TaxID=35570 RepID=UPI0027E256A6|nr:serine--tRNA synthetase-like protein Slimp [Stomoxys calcitrans]